MIGKALAFCSNIGYRKIDLFFWILTATGLVIARIGPALKVITILYLSYDFDYKSITLREAFRFFEKVCANLIFEFMQLYLFYLATIYIYQCRFQVYYS